MPPNANSWIRDCNVSTVAGVVNLIRPLQVYHTERPPLFATHSRDIERHTVRL